MCGDWDRERIPTTTDITVRTATAVPIIIRRGGAMYL